MWDSASSSKGPQRDFYLQPAFPESPAPGVLQTLWEPASLTNHQHSASGAQRGDLPGEGGEGSDLWQWGRTDACQTTTITGPEAQRSGHGAAIWTHTYRGRNTIYYTPCVQEYYTCAPCLVWSSISLMLEWFRLVLGVFIFTRDSVLTLFSIFVSDFDPRRLFDSDLPAVYRELQRSTILHWRKLQSLHTNIQRLSHPSCRYAIPKVIPKICIYGWGGS